MDSGFDVYPAEGVFATIVPKTRMLGKHGVLPERFDLSSTLSDVKEQGKWDSCTVFACCAALERLPYEGPNHQDESESFIWYNAKAVEIKLRGGNDDPAKDRATSLSAAIMAVQEFGSCREIACPYDASQPSSLAKPSEDAYEEALWKKGITAYQIDPGTTHKSKKQSLYLRDAIKQVLFLTHCKERAFLSTYAARLRRLAGAVHTGDACCSCRRRDSGRARRWLDEPPCAGRWPGEGRRGRCLRPEGADRSRRTTEP